MVSKLIETPMMSVAEHISYDKCNDPVYFDGVEYWIVLKNGRIESYDNE